MDDAFDPPNGTWYSAPAEGRFTITSPASIRLMNSYAALSERVQLRRQPGPAAVGNLDRPVETLGRQHGEHGAEISSCATRVDGATPVITAGDEK